MPYVFNHAIIEIKRKINNINFLINNLDLLNNNKPIIKRKINLLGKYSILKLKLFWLNNLKNKSIKIIIQLDNKNVKNKRLLNTKKDKFLIIFKLKSLFVNL